MSALRLPTRLTLPTPKLRTALYMLMAMLVATAAGTLLQPRLDATARPLSLEHTIPNQFGDWTAISSPFVQAALSVAATGQPSTDNPYDETVLRTYRNSAGHVVMLALAYGKNQRQEVKIHRPELCYPAQGFQVKSLQPTGFGTLAGANQPVAGHHMLVSGSQRTEAVSYWIRIGGVYSDSAWSTRMHIISEGLAGRVPDGILVRASQAVASPADASRAYAVLDGFMAELVAATPSAARTLLVR